MSVTVAESPPEMIRKTRSSKWAEVFEEGRANPGQWRRVVDPLKRSTVQQIASDVRNAHKKSEKARMRGILPKERWDAKWGAKDDGKFYVWVRYIN
jgi:hypothetical protein